MALKRFILKSSVVKAEMFDKNNTLPENVKSDISSATGYIFEKTIKPYVDEKPEKMPETITFKKPIEDLSYIVTFSNGKQTIMSKTDFENFFEEV